MKQLVLLSLIAVALCYVPFQVIFEWKSIDFEWPSEKERQYAVMHGNYIVANNYISTAKFWKDKMYLALPRWKGVPVTLGVTSAKPVDGITAPKLGAFPSWSMQKLGDCRAFQMVQSMEIDPKGRMWVLDTGRSVSLKTFLKETKSKCPARLVILDLENNGQILRVYNFPDHVARRSDTYLNDIVLDHEDGGLAYITDSGHKDPGIIVYSLKNNTSWKVRHDSMKTQWQAVGLIVAKTPVIFPMNVDGIALSPASSRDRKVYYSPLSSFNLYSVPVSALKNNATSIDQYVKDLGQKSSQTDGMMMSSTGVLYFGLLSDDAIAMWDTKNTSSFTTGQQIIWRNHVLTQWQDSFSIDEDGNLWCVTDKLQNYVYNHINIDKPNYRLIRTRIGVRSYQYYENGTAPELPDITGNDSSVTD